MNSKPIRPRKKIKNFFGGFKEFLRRYSVVGIAIAFVAGQAINDLVKKIVEGIITPTIQLVIPNKEFQSLVLEIRGVEFDIGGVIDATLRFFIILFLVYFLVRLIMRDEGLLPAGKK